MTTVDLPLLPLGRGKDLGAERGVECPGDLPAASDPDLVERARAAKEALGERVFVLGHHYQRDEVIQFADVTGDSFKLARDAAARPEAEYIVFCGVHFMAESADILTAPEQKVILPDLAAGCSMADMARLGQVEDAWDALTDAGVADSVVPVTYMNSSADIKAFCGRNGGAVCTSSNAEAALEWAFAQNGPRRARSSSSPTSTSAATPRCCRWGSPSTTAWSGTRTSPTAASPPSSCSDARMILWKGHCSVHGRFSRRRRRRAARDDPRRPDPGAPRVHATRWCSRPTWSAPRSSSSRPSRPRRPARAGRSAPSSTWSSGWPPPTRTSRSRSSTRPSATARR